PAQGTRHRHQPRGALRVQDRRGHQRLPRRRDRLTDATARPPRADRAGRPAPEQKGTTVTPTTQSANRRYHRRVKRLLPGGVHYNFNMPWEEVPLHFTGGERSRLYDMDGNEYLDLYARFGAMILGHAEEEYTKALEDAMRRVLCVSHC